MSFCLIREELACVCHSERSRRISIANRLLIGLGDPFDIVETTSAILRLPFGKHSSATVFLLSHLRHASLPPQTGTQISTLRMTHISECIVKCKHPNKHQFHNKQQEHRLCRCSFVLFYFWDRKIRCRISEPSPCKAQCGNPKVCFCASSGEVRSELILHSHLVCYFASAYSHKALTVNFHTAKGHTLAFG